MADNIPQKGALLETPPVFPPVPEVAKLTADLEADLKVEFEPEAELELLPLRVRPFDPERYHLQTYTLPANGGIRRFTEFARGAPEDLLLREPNSHLLAIAVEV